jgi:ferrous iron transport protein B
MEAAEIVRHWFGKGSCHGNARETEEGLRKIVLVGSPNVGKSVVFGNLTGKYVTVSNYPGTTVERQGKGKIGEREFEITDTPGMYSLLSITEEERVARSMLLEECLRWSFRSLTKNIERMLHLTLQLIEAEMLSSSTSISWMRRRVSE